MKSVAISFLIFILLPIFGIYLSGVVGGAFLCIATRAVLRFDMPYPRAIQTMALMSTIALAVALTTGLLLGAGQWVVVTSAWVVAFVAGVPIYARMIEHPDTGEIGPLGGLAVSAALTVVGVAITVLAVWRASGE